MIIYSVCDQHGYLPVIEEEHDLLLLGGDICPNDSHRVAYQQRWLDTDFRDWLQRTPAKTVVAVAGNHDFIFDSETDYAPMFETFRPSGVAVPEDLPWTYLQDSSVTINGLKIHGTPWQPIFGFWAFNLPEDRLAEKFSLIPEDVDILLSHGPPFKLGDKTDFGENAGSTSLRQRINEVRPQLVVCGHIHEARGVYDYNGITVVNSTVVNLNYDHVYPPMRFEVADGEITKTFAPGAEF